MKVIITGATGMIGSLILQKCLNDIRISQITVLTRRTTGIKREKLKEVIVDDFTNYTEFENYFKEIDIAYFCIGVYTGAVPREEFRKITVDYTQAFADFLKQFSPEAKLCFLSGGGADRNEKSRMMFAKDKGIAENYLINKKFSGLYIFRPAYIYPVTPRVEPNFSYKLSRKLYPVLKKLLPNAVITSEELANAMYITGVRGGQTNTYENKEIKKISIE